MYDTEITQPSPTPPPGPPAPVPATGSNGLAIAGFVLGLLGFLGSWIPVLNILGILLAVIGLVLAAVGLAKSGKVGSGKGLAIAGLVLSVLAIIVAVVINVAFVNTVDDSLDKATSTKVQVPAATDKAAAPEAEDVDDELGTTRDNPVPLRSAITGDDWTVKVNSVKTATKDSLGQNPKSGKTLLVVNVTATYNGDDEQGDSAWAGVKFVTPGGTTIDSTDGFFIPEHSFDSLKTVYHGASVTGDKMIEVPSDWRTGVLAVSPGLLTDDTFVAVK